MDVHKLIERDFVLLDGAMGTMLQQKGMAPGTSPETLNITHPDWIRDIHRQYIDAGADIIYSNTFGANRKKLADTPYTVSELIESAVALGKSAAKGTDTPVSYTHLLSQITTDFLHFYGSVLYSFSC